MKVTGLTATTDPPHVFRTNLVSSIDSAADIATEDIVDCGVSCSSLQSCSGLQYSSQTKTCKKMKKVGLWTLYKLTDSSLPCPPAALYPRGLVS